MAVVPRAKAASLLLSNLLARASDCGPWSALVAAALVVLYTPIVWETAHMWLTDEYSSHGILVPLLAGLLIWWRRHALAQIPRQSCYWGFVPLLGGLLLQMVAWYAGIRVFAMLSLVPVLIGICLLLGGARYTRVLLFPLLFLGFAAPVPVWLVQPVSFPIQNISCRAASWSVEQMGVPVAQEGFTVALSNGSAVEVANECSGFKKTLTVTVFACFYASLFVVPRWRQVALVLAAAPLAIAANIARVAALILAANIWGMAGVHQLHDFADPVVVALCFLMLVGLGKGLGCQKLRYSA